MIEFLPDLVLPPTVAKFRRLGVVGLSPLVLNCYFVTLRPNLSGQESGR